MSNILVSEVILLMFWKDWEYFKLFGLFYKVFGGNVKSFSFFRNNELIVSNILVGGVFCKMGHKVDHHFSLNCVQVMTVQKKGKFTTQQKLLYSLYETMIVLETFFIVSCAGLGIVGLDVIDSRQNAKHFKEKIGSCYGCGTRHIING